ncbi:hypothetical protein GMO_24600 [Gluconobacter morbifer G707]|uniref:Uncharacterized protein n=1 Tax=Gluconobacter morbifer G707 TaxID=1088869 RepID=G6XL37_9PROT|nr:hypothetical protein GMO_24600 [Gluconobacter morbifer G707]
MGVDRADGDIHRLSYLVLGEAKFVHFCGLNPLLVCQLGISPLFRFAHDGSCLVRGD